MKGGNILSMYSNTSVFLKIITRKAEKHSLPPASV